MKESFADNGPELLEAQVEKLRIYRGLDYNFARQLVRLSRQPHIAETCPGDAAERFVSVESALERGQRPDRETYILSPGQKVAGMIWYGEKRFPMGVPGHNLPHHTFAIRLYEGYAGKGLSQRFMDASLQDYLSLLAQRGQLDDMNGIWLGTGVDNTRAINLYRSYGYKDVGFINASEGNELIMVLSNAAVAERLQQPA